MKPFPWGGFALPDPSQVPEVMGLGLALEMADALLLMEAVFHLLPSPLPAARPLHTLARTTATHALWSASGALTTMLRHCLHPRLVVGSAHLHGRVSYSIGARSGKKTRPGSQATWRPGWTVPISYPTKSRRRGSYAAGTVCRTDKV